MLHDIGERDKEKYTYNNCYAILSKNEVEEDKRRKIKF